MGRITKKLAMGDNEEERELDDNETPEDDKNNNK